MTLRHPLLATAMLLLFWMNTPLLSACSPAAQPEAGVPEAPAPVAASPTSDSQASAAPASTATQEPVTLPLAPLAPAFTLTSDEPVVAHGKPGTWDGRFTDPGAVLYHEGVYHMFRNGFAAWPAKVGVAHLTSDDGYRWRAVGESPIFDEMGVPYAGLAVLASSALVEPDGTWALYFYTWDSQSSMAEARIGRATAPAPDGPWTADPAPVLEPGPEGAWDDYRVFGPSIVRLKEGYLMYYSGGQEAWTTNRIGLATSSNGVTWTKHDDPATTVPPYAASDPVLGASSDGEAWDGSLAYQPKVARTDDGFIMIYRGLNAVRRGAYGLATSEDGVRWERYNKNPVFSQDELPGSTGLWFHELLFRDGRYLLFVELSRGGGTDIYLATHEGSLRDP